MKNRILPLVCTAVLVSSTALAQDPAALPDRGWPREYAREDFQLVAYQPQIESWDDYLHLVTYMAVVLTPPGAGDGVPGAVKIEADTDTHWDTRTVFLTNLELTEVRFAAMKDTPEEKQREMIQSVFPEEPLAISLDRMLAMVDRSKVQTREVRLKDDPPEIIVSTTPAILVLIGGEPAWVKAEDSGLSYAANTNWDLFRLAAEKKKAKDKTYYLRHEESWLAADDLAGPWAAAGKKLPKPFKKLPKSPNFKEARVNVPGVPFAAGAVPAVYVRNEPAEMIVISGEPKLVPIPETPILVVENTEADLFRHIDDNAYFYLVSGRWFRAADLGGEWTAATGKLPAGFDRIPADHEKAHVRASVPGTPEAEEAVLQAQIPTVAKVSRAAAPKEVKVEYVGEPEFRDIEGTGLAYAVNTSSDVVRQGAKYYLCTQGVWFVSASPQGPWQVADQVPDEIYEIPASSPVHHTTYVYVYDSTPDTVTYGYTGGYVGMYVGWGCVVWGSGWHYPPYYYYGPYYPYPIYYPYPYTFGAGAWYNPATGFYGRGYSYYGPYGGAGRGAAYNPATGTYARGGYAYGYGGATKWGQAYNPRTGTRAAGYRSANAYASWGQGAVARGDEWLRAGGYSDARGSVRGFQTSEGQGGIRFKGEEGSAGVVKGKDNLYVGRDGNVYRRDDGGWAKHGDGGWSDVEKPARPEGGLSQAQKDALSGLDRSAAQRQRGNVDTDRYRSWKSSGGWSSGARGRSAGSVSRGGYGGRGGGARMGGRRGGSRVAGGRL